jgi:hypothetical protein
MTAVPSSSETTPISSGSPLVEADEHCDRRVVGLERTPVVAAYVAHIVVSDTVLAGARLDVHLSRLRGEG